MGGKNKPTSAFYYTKATCCCCHTRVGSTLVTCDTILKLHIMYSSDQIKGGKVHYISDAGVAGKVERNIPEVYAADGQWHSVLLEKNGSVTILSVDRTHSRDILHTTQDFGGLNVLTISLGGIPSSQPFKGTAAGTFFSSPKCCNFLSVISVCPSFAEEMQI